MHVVSLGQLMQLADESYKDLFFKTGKKDVVPFDRYEDNLRNVNNLNVTLVAMLDQTIEQIPNPGDYYPGYLQIAHPLSDTNAALALDVIVHVFEKLAQDLELKYQSAKLDLQTYYEALDKNKVYLRKYEQRPNRVVYIEKQVQNAIRILESNCIDTLKRELAKHDIEDNDLESELLEAWIYVLNTGHRWTPIEQKLFLSLSEAEDVFVSRITPAHFINETFLKYYNEDNISGVSSLDRAQMHHAVNLNLTEYFVEDKTLLRCVRSGVLSGVGIIDGAKRMESGMARGREVLRAIVVARLKDAQDQGENVENIIKNSLIETAPLEIKLVSISLLTPDKMRHWIAHIYNKYYMPLANRFEFLKKFSCCMGEIYHKDERQQFIDQVNVYHELASKPQKVELTWNEKEYVVWVQLKPILFNWCVNARGMEHMVGIPPKYLPWSGWKLANKFNEEGLKQLLGNLNKGEALDGAVEEYFRRKDLRKDIESHNIITLAEQIKYLWITQEYMNDIRDPYKMAVRVLILAKMLGYQTAFSCMNGKDRSGMLDVEAKYLMTHFNLRGFFHDPMYEFPSDEKNVYTALALYAGNMEIQRYNVGIGGSRTDYGSNDPLLEKFIDVVAREWHMGGWNAFQSFDYGE